MEINELKPLEKNPFKPGDDTIDRLAKSIEDFQKMLSIRKIVIDESNTILGGNKKYFALKQLGYKQIPDEWIDQKTNLTEGEKERFIITDNAHFGSLWDYELLEDWDKEKLEEWGMDLESFDNTELDVNNFEGDMEIKLKYPENEYWDIKEKLSKIASTPEHAVKKLLNG